MVVLFAITAAYYLIANLFQFAFVILSYRSLRANPPGTQDFEIFLKNSSSGPKVTFIVPAFNEAPVIADSIKSISRVYYPSIEILIINDGSKDETQSVLLNEFQLETRPIPRHSLLSNAKIKSHHISRIDSRIRLIHQENAGKSMALNTGIDHAEGELVVTMDADTILEEDALIRTIPHFIQDPALVGVSGIIRILNGTRMFRHRAGVGHLPFHPLALFQVIEYMRAFYLGRLAWDQAQGTLLLSGAFSIFKKKSLLDVGGFSPTSITEDLEIVVRIRRGLNASGTKGHFRLIPYPVCWTQAPQSLEHLQKQRWRWQSGLISTFIEHRQFIFSKGSGVAGWLAVPYLIIFEGLSPVVELITIVAMGAHMISQKHEGQHLETILSIGLIGLFLSWCFNVIAIHWTETRFRRHSTNRHPGQWLLNMFQLATASFFEMLFFHPMVSWWKLQALIRYPFVKTKWGQKPRTEISKMENESRRKSA